MFPDRSSSKVCVAIIIPLLFHAAGPLKYTEFKAQARQLQTAEMPKPPGSSDPDLWTADLPPSQETSVGCIAGGRITTDGSTEQSRENEDRYYTCSLDGIQLYLVLDGHNGSRACEFALKRMPSLLLQYDMGGSGEKAAEALKHTFENTEKHFFMMLDHSITQKMGLQMQMQEQGGTTSMLAYSMFPDKVEELQRLEEQINGGTTAVVALILNNHKLWVANVGDSRAVLCYLDGSGKLRAEQISEDHNTRNDKEIVRLVECGLDELSLRSSGRLGVHQNTRSIGDYSIKGGYKDHDILSVATREPGTAEPFISHPPLDITTIRGFLLLMSDGLYDAHSATTGSLRTVNHDIACLVQRHMDHVHSVEEVSQKVIAEIVASFRAMVQRGQQSARLDDITLIIRNLGYPVGQLTGIMTAPPNLQNPFNFSQSHPTAAAQMMSGQPHYENSRAATTQSSQMYVLSASNAGYSPSNYTSTHPTTNPPPLPAQFEGRTNSPYGQQDATPCQPYPSGPNTQLSPPYPPSSSSSAAEIAFPPPTVSSAVATSHTPMRKSGSDSRVNPSPGSHGSHALWQGYGTGYHSPSPRPEYHHTHRQHNSNSSSQLPPTTTPPNRGGGGGDVVYENWELKRNRDRSKREHAHSSSNVADSASEVASGLAAVRVGSSPPVSLPQNLPPPSREGSSSVVTSLSSGPHHTETSTTTTTTTTTTSQHIPTDATASTLSMKKSESLIRRQSTIDDDSWMYNQDPIASTPAGSSHSPSTSEKETTPREGEGGGSGGVIIGGDSGGEGVGREDGTEMVELEWPNDDREEPSDTEHEGEEVDGMIKPIIKFDKFPPDLSWDQI